MPVDEARRTLPRGSRVRRSREVRRAFDLGRPGAAGPVVVYAFDRGDALPARYALVVGRRWGGAVERNRVRRLLREAFRLERPGLPAGFDCVLVPRSDVASVTLAALRDDVRTAARSAARRFRREGPGAPRPDAGRKRRR